MIIILTKELGGFSNYFLELKTYKMIQFLSKVEGLLIADCRLATADYSFPPTTITISPFTPLARK
jgi:hypothetical protein